MSRLLCRLSPWLVLAVAAFIAVGCAPEATDAGAEVAEADEAAALDEPHDDESTASSEADGGEHADDGDSHDADGGAHEDPGPLHADEVPDEVHTGDHPSLLDDTADVVAEVTVDAGDMYYDGIPDELPAGPVRVAMENVGMGLHDLVVAELDDLQVIGVLEPGETAEATVDLAPGTYELYCSLPGHREAGMVTTVEVVE